jgi:hypothetical protein
MGGLRGILLGVLAALQAGRNHDQNHQRIGKQQDRMKRSRLVRESYELERYVHRTTASRKSLGPGAPAQQAIGLDKPQRRVRRSPQRQEREPGVLKVARGGDEDFRISRRRVEMRVLNKLDRYGCQVLVHERQHAGGGEQHHQALKGFEQRDDSDGAFQSVRRSMLMCAA